MNEVRIVIAGVPQGMRAPQFATIRKRDGGSFVHAYQPSHVKKWESYARMQAQEQMGQRPPLIGPVRLDIEIHLPVPKSLSGKKTTLALQGVIRPTTRPDTTNYIKTAEDSLNGIVFHDDSQVVELSARKLYSDRPRIEMVIQKLVPDVSLKVIEGTLFAQK